MHVQSDFISLRRGEIVHPIDELLLARGGHRRIGERVWANEVREQETRVPRVQALLAFELGVAVVRIIPIVRDDDVERMTLREANVREREAIAVRSEQHAMRANRQVRSEERRVGKGW